MTEDLDALCRDVTRLAADAGPDATAALVERLAHPSWYLRERVVAALATRGDAVEPALGVLRRGAWWARASACDVLAQRAGATAVDDVLVAIEDPSVSLQKSAVRALVAIAGRAGAGGVAATLAALDPARRRRITARVGHQAPAWAEELDAALSALPPSAFAAATPAPPRAADASAGRILTRFRAWLHASGAVSPGGEGP